MFFLRPFAHACMAILIVSITPTSSEASFLNRLAQGAALPRSASSHTLDSVGSPSSLQTTRGSRPTSPITPQKSKKRNRSDSSDSDGDGELSGLVARTSLLHRPGTAPALRAKRQNRRTSPFSLDASQTGANTNPVPAFSLGGEGAPQQTRGLGSAGGFRAVQEPPLWGPM